MDHLQVTYKLLLNKRIKLIEIKWNEEMSWTITGDAENKIVQKEDTGELVSRNE